MATKVKFVIFNRHDNAKEIDIDIVPGTTIPELARQCADHPKVTATAKEMIVASCIVDGKYWPPKSSFTGAEKEVSFIELLRGG